MTKIHFHKIRNKIELHRMLPKLVFGEFYQNRLLSNFYLKTKFHRTLTNIIYRKILTDIDFSVN